MKSWINLSCFCFFFFSILVALRNQSFHSHKDLCSTFYGYVVSSECHYALQTGATVQVVGWLVCTGKFLEENTSKFYTDSGIFRFLVTVCWPQRYLPLNIHECGRNIWLPSALCLESALVKELHLSLSETFLLFPGNEHQNLCNNNKLKNNWYWHGKTLNFEWGGLLGYMNVKSMNTVFLSVSFGHSLFNFLCNLFLAFFPKLDHAKNVALSVYSHRF